MTISPSPPLAGQNALPPFLLEGTTISLYPLHGYTLTAAVWTRETTVSTCDQKRERRRASLPLLEGIQLHPHESLLYHHMAICFISIGPWAQTLQQQFFSYRLTITLSSSLHSTQEPQTDNPSNQPISVASHRLSISVGSKTAYTSSVSLLT